jgi:general secretion pathway protein A
LASIPSKWIVAAVDERKASTAGSLMATPSESRRGHVLPLYSSFYGLHEAPFDLTPDPHFLFLAAPHREALSNLRYALSTPRGFTLLVGDAGTGKTTLVRAALDEPSDSAKRYVLVTNPTLGHSEFYELLARDFGLSDRARSSKTQFLSELQQNVEARFIGGGLTGLIIDEAQSMPDDLLEEIRLLGNLETPTTKLLNIILSGQPELAERLNKPSLRQLKQRVALRCELRALTLDETAAYISGRLRIAGGSPKEIFTRETVVAIHEAACGIPRTINVLCDNALIGGLAVQAKPVHRAVIDEVCRDFDLLGPEKSATPIPAVDQLVSEPAAPLQSLSSRSTAPSQPSSGAGSTCSTSPSRPRETSTVGERPMFGSVNAPTKKRFSFFR